MIPQKNQHVKCFMRSGMVLEGIVEEWTEAQVVLKSIDDQSLMIVHRPIDDIILTKIILRAPKIIPQLKEGIKNKLQEIQQTEDPDLNKKNITELQQMVIEHDKQIILNKRKEHFGSQNSGLTHYGSQSLLPIISKK